jgi:hypothetical protein
MKMAVFHQHLDDRQPLSSYLQSPVPELLNHRFFGHLHQSGTIPDYP